MKPIRYGLFAVVAAIASAAAVANFTASLTPKQALLQGLPAPARAIREPVVSRLIVKFREAPTPAPRATEQARRTQALATTSRTELGYARELAGGASLVTLPGAMPLSRARELAARLAGDPAVEFAEPDVMMRRLAIPNETRFAEWQWNLFVPGTVYTGPFLDSAATRSALAVGGINMPPAWDLSGGGSSAVVVAVIDTGLVNHPDLNGIAFPAPYTPAGRFVAGYDFISPDVEAGTLPLHFVENDGPQQRGRDDDPTDPGDWLTTNEELLSPTCDDGNPGPQNSSWHGTHMAGIVAATANNGEGIAGIGWNLRVQPIRALGKCGGSLSDIAEAIRWAAGLPVPGVPFLNATPARVISLSLGGSESCSATMQAAVDAALAAGSVIVAATGNEGETELISPADCSGVIAVTAHTITGENADYANINAKTAISAPGGGSPVTDVGGRLGTTDDPNWSGYYVWSALLFSPTTPDSFDAQGRTGAAYGGFNGTSAATPHVAGVAALIKSILPSATPAQIRAYIRNTARAFPPGTACAPGGAFVGQCGAGLLDAGAALASAAAVAAPIIVAAPQSQRVIEGQSATFTVSAAGAPTLMYQWRRNGSDIAGATGATYTTPPLTSADTGTRYSVVVTNGLGAATTADAIVTVGPPEPPPPSGGGGGGGALPPGQVLLAALLLVAARLRRRE